MKVKIKLNKNIPPYKAGKTLLVNVDDNGIPIDRFWRDRFKDNLIDNCLEIIKEDAEAKNSKPKKEA
jgi:hypothetical protein